MNPYPRIFTLIIASLFLPIKTLDKSYNIVNNLHRFTTQNTPLLIVQNSLFSNQFKIFLHCLSIQLEELRQPFETITISHLLDY
jgi:hypothetical protein